MTLKYLFLDLAKWLKVTGNRITQNDQRVFGPRFDEKGKRPINPPFFMKDERHSMCTGEKDDFIANPDINLVGAPYGCRKNLREIDGKILGFPLMTP
jgi:hypothetical protein